LEYVLNTLNTVLQVTVPAARDLQDILSRAITQVFEPLQRLAPAWPMTATPTDTPAIFILIGLLVFVTGYVALRPP
jgi:hypothetical protein